MTIDATGSDGNTGSPCVRNCCLDEQDVCLGCHRTIAEIVGWNAAPAQEKLEILARCSLRARQRQDKNRRGSNRAAGSEVIPLDQPITGFHQDDAHDWVAELACGHFQHVRHDPPWTNRPWVITPEGRATMLGHPLPCKKCVSGVPPDALGPQR